MADANAAIAGSSGLDAYRRESREAVSAVLAAGAHFQQAATTMGSVSNWITLDYPQASALKAELDDTRQKLRETVGVALLLVQDDDVRTALYALDEQFQEVVEGFHRLMAAFWGKREADVVAAEFDISHRLDGLGEALFGVHERSISALRPTVFDEVNGARKRPGAWTPCPPARPGPGVRRR
jgi:hypothetical protein